MPRYKVTISYQDTIEYEAVLEVEADSEFGALSVAGQRIDEEEGAYRRVGDSQFYNATKIEKLAEAPPPAEPKGISNGRNE